jgi:hypothetical protein
VLVRASAAEAREARYRAQGRDCYLFNLDDAHVLDATQAGAISRFTVRAAGGAAAAHGRRGGTTPHSTAARRWVFRVAVALQPRTLSAVALCP